MSDADYIPGGYVLLARIMQDSAIWRDDPHVLKLFIYLIMEARFDMEPKKFPGFDLKRGEVLTSLSRIADDNEYFRHSVKKWSRSKVSRMLEKLQDQGYIEQVSDTYGTHIRITKYETYQNPDLYVANSSETLVKQQCNASATLVNIRNKGNKDNNDKNVKKEYNSEFEILWKIYERKGNKISAFKQFQRLTKIDIVDIKDKIGLYIASTPDKQFRKDFERWLNPNKRCWEDEITVNPTKTDVLQETRNLFREEENEELRDY